MERRKVFAGQETVRLANQFDAIKANEFRKDLAKFGRATEMA